MNKLLLIFIVLVVSSCGNENEITKIKENQAKLEARIVKLEKDMKEQMKIDSILLEFQKPKPGSLLSNLEKNK